MLERLLALVFPSRADEALVRAAHPDDFLARLVPHEVCDTHPATTALLPYRDPLVRAAIHEAKYRGTQHARRLLAAALAEYLRDTDAFGSPHAIALVPIPLGAARQRERGYNQIEEIAALAVRDLHGAYELESFVLVRARETVSQVSLPRAKRLENMRGAFTASQKLHGAHGAMHPLDQSRTYIVLDDVVTTGATMQAAIDALAAGGATDIIPLALSA